MVNDHEWNTALHVFKPTKRTVIEHLSFYSASLTLNLTKINIILSQAADQGSSSSQLLVSTALRSFHIRLVVNAGCAFGMDVNKQKLFDVLVSSHICSYEHVREGIDRENRNLPIPVNTNISNLIKPLVKTWSFLSSPPSETSESQLLNALLGMILCGDKLLDNKDKKDAIKLLLGVDKGDKLGGVKVVGGEMESSGMITASQHHSNTACLLIKGISDWAQNKDASPDGTDVKAVNQRCASYTSMHVIIHLLSSLSATKSLQTLPSSRYSDEDFSTVRLRDGEEAVSSKDNKLLGNFIAAHTAFEAEKNMCAEQRLQEQQRHQDAMSKFKPKLQAALQNAREKLQDAQLKVHKLEQQFELNKPQPPEAQQLDPRVVSTYEIAKKTLLQDWPAATSTLLVDNVWTVTRNEKKGQARWSEGKVEMAVDDPKIFKRVMQAVKPPILTLSVRAVNADDASSHSNASCSSTGSFSSSLPSEEASPASSNEHVAEENPPPPKSTKTRLSGALASPSPTSAVLRPAVTKKRPSSAVQPSLSISNTASSQRPGKKSKPADDCQSARDRVNVKWEECESSTVAYYGYASESGKLFVQFTNGKIYSYNKTKEELEGFVHGNKGAVIGVWRKRGEGRSITG